MDNDQLAPIDYVIVEFPNGTAGAEGFRLLLDLCDRGVIDLLDLEFVRKQADGTISVVAPREVTATDGFDMGVWEGTSARLLDDDDLAQVGSQMGGEGIAAVIVYENRWLFSLTDAWRAGGARLLADGGLPVAEFVAALDDAERTEA